MRIVKSFRDNEYLEKVYHWKDVSPDQFWEWGLGEDGDLYFKCSYAVNPEEWHQFSESGQSVLSHITIRDMKRIVKEFGDLLVFL